jgi:hypothetical protein
VGKSISFFPDGRRYQFKSSHLSLTGEGLVHAGFMQEADMKLLTAHVQFRAGQSVRYIWHSQLE